MSKLSTAQLSVYLSVTKRTIQRRAIKEHWLYEEQIGLGGTKRLYPFATLPQKVKSRVIASIIANHESHANTVIGAQEGEGANTPFGDDPGNWLTQHCLSYQLEQTTLNKDYVKLGLLNMARLFVSRSGFGKIKGFDVFCQQYNDRTLQIDSAVFKVTKRISRISLLRWEKKEPQLAQMQERQEDNIDTEVVIDKELRTMAEEVLMVSPTISAKRLRQHFLTFFSDKKIPTEQLLSQWIRQSHVTT